MNIKTMFEFGQTVWPVERVVREVNKDCPCCEGTGNLFTHSGQPRECHRCYGNKAFVTHEIEWKIKNPGVVARIKTDHDAAGRVDDVFYFIDGNGSRHKYHEDFLFASKRLAKQHCELWHNK